VFQAIGATQADTQSVPRRQSQPEPRTHAFRISHTDHGTQHTIQHNTARTRTQAALLIFGLSTNALASDEAVARGDRGGGDREARRDLGFERRAAGVVRRGESFVGLGRGKGGLGAHVATRTRRMNRNQDTNIYVHLLLQADRQQ